MRKRFRPRNLDSGPPVDQVQFGTVAENILESHRLCIQGCRVEFLVEVNEDRASRTEGVLIAGGNVPDAQRREPVFDLTGFGCAIFADVAERRSVLGNAACVGMAVAIANQRQEEASVLM